MSHSASLDVDTAGIRTTPAPTPLLFGAPPYTEVGQDTGRRLTRLDVPPSNDPTKSPIINFIIASRESNADDAEDAVQTKATLRAGNIAVANRAIQEYAHLNIGEIRFLERIRRTRDGILRQPLPGGQYYCQEEVDLFWTLEDFRLRGERVCILQRGYDGITEPVSLKLFFSYWDAKGLNIMLQTYQKTHSATVRTHMFYRNVMIHSPIMDGHVCNAVYTAPQLTTMQPTYGVAQYLDILQKICDAKLQGRTAWYNQNRNDY